tara:strand:+ start:286 stop:582 length:297 start_codon:yes stop_codon:yes gene_type:complete
MAKKEKQKRDYNIMSLDGVTDQEYVELFDVPPNVANTPEINNWLINDTYEKNLELEYNAAIKNGRSEQEAVKWSHKVANKGRKDARNLLNQVQQKRGY